MVTHPELRLIPVLRKQAHRQRLRTGSLMLLLRCFLQLGELLRMSIALCIERLQGI